MKLTGLTNDEVLKSRKMYGTNSISKLKKHTFLSLLIESFGDPIIKILLIALISIGFHILIEIVYRKNFLVKLQLLRDFLKLV